MEALIIVLMRAAAAMVVAAAYCGWCERRDRQEVQALSDTYIGHLRAARRIVLKNAESTEQSWLTSAKMFRDANQLQAMIESAQRDYPHDIADIGRVKHNEQHRNVG